MEQYDRKPLEDIAYFAVSTYRKGKYKERMIREVEKKFPNVDEELIRAMIYAIDAYVDETELEQAEKKIKIGESYQCEGCGHPIFTSSYCDHCRKLWES